MTTATLKVGRFGLDLTVAAPMQVSLEGDRLSLSGFAYGTTQEQAQALRQQCVGLAGNPDEPVVPLRASWDSTLDGFYRVGRATAELDPGDNARFRVRYSIDCERVSSFAMPRVECILRGVTRSGSSGSGFSATFWHARPDQWDGYTTSSTGVTSFAADVTGTSSGDLVYYAQNTALSNATVTVTTTTSSYYAAASSVYQGTSLYRVNGRQSFNYPSSWRLDNGMFRVGPASDSTHLFKVSSYAYNGGGTWSTPYDIELGYVSGITWNTYSCEAPYVLRVLRNGPEECVLRLQYQTATSVAALGAISAHQVDLGLRRGERGVRVAFRSLAENTTSKKWGLMFRPLTTCVSTGYASYGLEFSAADSGSRKFWMVTATSCAMGVAGGRIYLNTAGTTLDAFIGATDASGSDLAGYGATGWQARYYGAMNEVQRVTLP